MPIRPRRARRCAPCTAASASIPPRRVRPRRRCCAACARATGCRASTRWWTSATGARSSSSCRTACTTSRRFSHRSPCGLGTEGESYPGIRKDVVNVADRLTLADQAGPFGNPTSDSARTMVTEATRRRCWTVVFAPAETTPARLATVLEATAERLTPVCRRSADPSRRHIISGCDACGGRGGGRRAGHAPWHGGAQAVSRAGGTVAARAQRERAAGLATHPRGHRGPAGGVSGRPAVRTFATPRVQRGRRRGRVVRTRWPTPPLRCRPRPRSC